MSVPNDPAAETTPSILLRRASETARMHAVIAKDVAVQDNAIPIKPPETMSASAPCATAMIARPIV